MHFDAILFVEQFWLNLQAKRKIVNETKPTVSSKQRISSRTSKLCSQTIRRSKFVQSKFQVNLCFARYVVSHAQSDDQIETLHS